MKKIPIVVGLGLLMAVPAWADLVSPAAPSAGASVRISEATKSAGTASALSLADASTNTKANFVFFTALHLNGSDNMNGGAGGNGGDNNGNDNNGGTNNGGGDGGSANGGGTNGGGGGQVPAPAASVLAMVGMACVTWLKRRV